MVLRALHSASTAPSKQTSIDGWRMVVDFRNLNAETKADSHPLPLDEEKIVKTAKGKLFSVLDLRHGFHQMPLANSSKPLTCMCSPMGTAQWTVMPIGLKNAPSFFQRMMEEVLFSEHPELRELVSVYIDDIIIATVGDGLTKQELVDLHKKQLNMVLDILDKNQLICGPKKGKLFLESVNFCGSLLRNGTPSRVQGSSLQFRSGSAQRPFRPFVDSLAVVIFTILSSRIMPGTPPPLLNYSRLVGRLVVRAQRCECSGPTSAMRRLCN